MTTHTPINASAAGRRADLFLHAYFQQDGKRSLTRLQSALRESGVSVSLSTLKRYSRDFHWRERVAELDRAARERSREQHVEHKVAMHDRHAQLGRALQGAGGSALQRLLNNDGRLAASRPRISRALSTSGCAPNAVQWTCPRTAGTSASVSGTTSWAR